ncbi:EamA family transporter [Thiothrix winogradskyi]|uniref:EamA family transporter n=1 Tax=Thiothrix winogradskyi TaxID=96472 RepID=A0ABY3T3D5_9GAMM|nr:EamA family transporter [Thiothrix winogradskyi]UJS26357.1 EamA family transporter [Thiothrix winogradskyi]
MERWVTYAFISMFFAGFTSVIAKQGLVGISGELGLTIRTIFVFAMVLGFAWYAVPAAAWSTVSKTNLFWLGMSGVTTTLSWIFYYKALKLGDVATVALIDKGSVVIAMIMAWLLLKEVITLRMLVGAAMIMGGLLVIAKK